MCIHYTHVDLFILIHNISFTKVFSMCSPTHSHNIQVFPMCSPTHSHYNIHSQPHSMTVRDRMRVVVVVLVVVVVDAERLPWSQRGRGRRSKHHRPIRIQYFWWRPIGTDHGFWTNQKPASSNLDEWEARIMFSAAPTGDRTVALQQNNTVPPIGIIPINFPNYPNYPNYPN